MPAILADGCASSPDDLRDDVFSIEHCAQKKCRTPDVLPRLPRLVIPVGAKGAQHGPQSATGYLSEDPTEETQKIEPTAKKPDVTYIPAFYPETRQ